jgi:hypothetical protein
MLESPKNKKVLFNAMVCCDVDIESMDQLKISFQEKKAQTNSDLDEF